jgi:hypothetical protein
LYLGTDITKYKSVRPELVEGCTFLEGFVAFGRPLTILS